MHLLQIPNPEALQIFLRRADRRVPQNPLEVVEVSASPQIINAKRMTQRMKTTTNPGNPKFLTSTLEISKEITLHKLRGN